MSDGWWVEVGDGVLARRHTELDLTTGLVLGTERALVIDTRGDVEQGAELAAAVRAVTTLPLIVAITHAHFDHCFGTAAFLPLGGHRRAPVYAHPRCITTLRATAAAQRTEWTEYYRARGDHATAAALAGTDPPLPDQPIRSTDPELPDHSTDPQLPNQPVELTDLSQLYRPTNLRRPAGTTLDLGNRPVELRYLGRGHTDHDLVAHIPDAAVLFAGDLVEQGAPPDLGDAVVAEWPATLTALLALAPRTVVPGHGDPVDAAFVAGQRDALAEVAALHAAVDRGEIDPATADRRSPYPICPGRPPSAEREPALVRSAEPQLTYRGDGGPAERGRNTGHLRLPP